MSTLEVNKIPPVSGGTTVQVGESGDTINIPAGATIANAGTATGFGVSLANGADNRVVTASSASALNGESTLTYDGSDLSVGIATPTFTNGNGLHLNSVSDNLRLHLTNTATGTTASDGADIAVGSDGALNIINKENAVTRFYTNDTERMKISGTGEVSIGDTSSITCRVESNRPGTGTQTHINFNNGSGTVGTIKTSGSATQFNTSSDYRLKENAVAISDGITRLKTLKPYRFNFKLDKDEDGNVTKTVDGFFAHEVTAVPEAISGEKDGEEMQGIDQSKLVPLLTSALQEAITKIETLEAKVAALESA